MDAILTTLAATAFMQVGAFLWKISANVQAKRPKVTSVVENVKRTLFDWRFLLGYALSTGGWVLFIQATALGDISVVQPLMSAGEFLLVLLAVVFLHERLSRKEWGGIFLVILGTVLLSLGKIETEGLIFHGFRLFIFIALLVLSAGFLVTVGKRLKKTETWFGIAIGFFLGSGAVLTKAMTIHRASIEEQVFGLTTLIDPLFWALVAANICGLVLLQIAFRKGRASVIVPFQDGVTNAVAVMGGLLIYGEQITWSRLLGVGVIIVGIAFLKSKNA